jgi:hypothetical protein
MSENSKNIIVEVLAGGCFGDNQFFARSRSAALIEKNLSCSPGKELSNAFFES